MGRSNSEGRQREGEKREEKEAKLDPTGESFGFHRAHPCSPQPVLWVRLPSATPADRSYNKNTQTQREINSVLAG